MCIQGPYRTDLKQLLNLLLAFILSNIFYFLFVKSELFKNKKTTAIFLVILYITFSYVTFSNLFCLVSPMSCLNSLIFFFFLNVSVLFSCEIAQILYQEKRIIISIHLFCDTHNFHIFYRISVVSFQGYRVSVHLLIHHAKAIPLL